MDVATTPVGTGDAVRLAILVGGDADATALATTLLAAAERWTVRRVDAPLTRLAVKQAFDAISSDLVAAAVLLQAPVIEVGGELALVVGDDPVGYPDDATIPLAWLAARLGAGPAPTMVVLDQALDPAAALAVFTRHLPGALIVVSGPGAATTATLATALGGQASDPTTGTVTLASLGAFVAARAPRALVRQIDDRAAFISPGALDLLRSRRHDAPAAAAVVTPAAVGTVLPGRFRLDRELARGTFGTVYRARQLAVERDVAIKLLHADIDPSSPDGQLFLQEIRAVGRLDHPNVVRIHQADVAHDGRLFFAMELLAGQTLAELAASGPLDLGRAVALVRQVLAGLGAAHEAGLIHADVKPANVIVVPGRPDERAVLLDFGLARLRATEPAPSAGGTPAFMAPEQLRDGRVDARSDLFATALILVFLLTGWRRRKASELVPPLDSIGDVRVRAALARALAIEPGARFATAAEFAAALAGEVVAVEPPPSPPPFHGLASFTERDHERLRGRDRELTALLDHALFRSVVVVTAPSGTGKTSLLRAGLVPALARYGATVAYVSGRETPVAAAIVALAAGADELSSAIAACADRTGARVVLIVDQLEALLDDRPDHAVALSELMAAALCGRTDVALVLSVREDFLARVLTRPELARAAVATVRIGPMDLDGARAAIVDALAERRVTIAPDLLAAVLDDLAGAGAALAPELGWGSGAAVYPPHLQLVGAVLYQTLGADESVLTLDHYRRLGGFEAIVGEHLERVLENELDRAGAAIARELFMALVTSTHARAMRPEPELLAIATAAGDVVSAVLEILRRQGLVVRTQRAVGEPVWELVHDSLVPRVLAWIDRHDLARRLAVEQVRYHLRRSRGDSASLLTRAELRELDAHAGALAELEAEHRRKDSLGLGPAALVAQSRAVVRRTTAATIALAATVVGIVGYAGCDRYRAGIAAARERSIRDRDLGRFTLELRPFDWVPAGVNPWLPGGAAVDVPVNELPDLRWTIHDPDPDDPTSPGPERTGARAPSVASIGPGTYQVETPGGAAFLIVRQRHRNSRRPCAPSIIPLRNLPGYAARSTNRAVRVPVPTCDASVAGTVAIDDGPFREGGVGKPISWVQVKYGHVIARERQLAAFRIDRTEVTNAAYAVFAVMARETGATVPSYPSSDELATADGPAYPVSAIGWRDARAFCRFLGKQLPTDAQFQKAQRGGLVLPDGTRNPAPERNLPWGTSWLASAHIGLDRQGPAPVASYPSDVSPYGVLDLAGNMEEWVDARDERGMVMTRGGNWAYSTTANLVDMIAVASPRPEGLMVYFLGLRCAGPI